MRVGVILSTSDQPEYLRLDPEGYSLQSRRPDRILVADDGSGPATAEVVAQAARETGLPILHVWHPVRGFRKTEVLNRAMAVVDEEFLISSDGDCIPRRDLVHGHLTPTDADRFVSGGYLKLPSRTSAAITLQAVRDERVFSLSWLKVDRWCPGRPALRLLPDGRAARLLEALTPTAATWNGHNASTLRRHLLAVNGFDLEMATEGKPVPWENAWRMPESRACRPAIASPSSISPTKDPTWTGRMSPATTRSAPASVDGER